MSTLPLPSPVAVRTALQTLPQRQAAWVGAQVAAAVLLALAGVWTANPNVAVAMALGAGAGAVNPRRIWALPAVCAATLAAGLFFDAQEWPAVLAAGLVAGAAAALLLPEATDALDVLNGALGTAAGASLGLWTASQLLPADLGGVFGAATAAALTGLIACQGLLPVAIRLDGARVPSGFQVRRALRPDYRAAVFRAIALYQGAASRKADADTRRGLAEVATWVFHLQQTLQALDDEIATIDPESVAERIRACDVGGDADKFTRERRRATADHLRRLLDHRAAMGVERQRNDAMVDYALAFLEEARVGLGVARELPGESTPERLPDVLGRLRAQAAEGDVRRKTRRELA